MANKKITQLVNKTTILSTDLFPIGDATTGQLYKKTVAELQAAIGGAVISVNAKVGTVVLTTDDVLETVSPANQYFTTTRSRASVSATTPLAYNSSTGVFSIPVATTSANGYLSSTDWTTFNGKENVLTFSGPLVRTTNTISIPVATTSVNGYLSYTDWTTFNGKQGALTLTVTGSSGASTLVGTTLNIPTYTLAGLGGITATFLSAGAGITYSSSTGIIASTITQYTDALARAAHSFTAGSGAYNSTTGVITIPTNTSQLTNGAAFITLTSLSGSTGISYNSTTGAISSTITQYTDALARASLSFTAGSGGYNSTTGVITIPTNTSQLTNGAGFITGITSGNVTTALGYTPVTNARTLTIQGTAYDLTADRTWTISGTLSGLTTNYIPKATGANSLGNSNLINDSSGNLGLGVTPSAWSSTWKALEIGNLGNSLTSNNINSIGITANAVLTSTGWQYANSGYANFYNVGLAAGQFVWYNAPSSTAGSTITFTQAMTLTNGGNLLVGTTTDSGYKLDVNGSGRFSAGLNTLGGTRNIQMISYAADINYLRSSGANFWFGVSDVADLVFLTNNVNRLTINSIGAATFSSSVTATGLLQINNSSNVSTIQTNSESSVFAIVSSSSLADYKPRIELYGTSYGSGVSDTIVYRAATQIFTSSTAATERMRITSAGNVGIGTTNPGYTLQVDGASTVGFVTSIVAKNPSTNAASAVKIGLDGGGTIWGEIGASYNSNSPYLAFFVRANSEKMRITDAGNVGIGTTSATNAKLKVSSSSAGGSIMSEDTTSTTSFVRILGDISSQNLINWQSGTAMRFAVSNQDFTSFSEVGRITSGGNWLLGTATDNGERLYVSGAIRATGPITANSDIRLKKNLERIENALEKVGQISGYTYNTIYDDKRHGGVIAQEIDEVFPEIVNKGNDGLLGVEYGNISALLIEALKEATTKIKALESKVEALQNL